MPSQKPPALPGRILVPRGSPLRVPSLSAGFATCLAWMRFCHSMTRLTRLGGALLRPARRLHAALPSLPSLPQLEHASLSDATIERFNEDGAVVVRSAVPEPWLDVLRDAAERNLSNPGPLCDEHASAAGTGGRFHDDQFLWHRHEAFEEFVLRSGAGALAARAMRSSSAHILYDQLFVKEPGTAAPTPWHNDTSYWHIRGEQICSLWVRPVA